MKNSLKCPDTSLEKLFDCAFKAIIEARLNLVDRDEALDALWEYLVNIDYEIRRLRIAHD